MQMVGILNKVSTNPLDFESCFSFWLCYVFLCFLMLFLSNMSLFVIILPVGLVVLLLITILLPSKNLIICIKFAVFLCLMYLQNISSIATSHRVGVGRVGIAPRRNLTYSGMWSNLKRFFAFFSRMVHLSKHVRHTMFVER